MAVLGASGLIKMSRVSCPGSIYGEVASARVLWLQCIRAMHARVFEGGERIGLRSVTSSRSGLHRAARLLATERVGDAVHKHQDTARSKHATHSKQQRRCVSPCATATHSASSGRLSVAHTLQRATDLRYPVPIFACGCYTRNGGGYAPVIGHHPKASRGLDIDTSHDRSLHSSATHPRLWRAHMIL